MKLAWISGWAVPDGWFAAQARAVWPEAEHAVVPAGPGAMDALERIAAEGTLDMVGGYSLGSHLLLAEAERVGRLAAGVVLLAPVFAFAREEALGGRSGRTHVRYMRRWLRTDPLSALRDFYLRAGLDIAPGDEPAADGLDWGLEVLERGRINPPAPAGWRLFCGEVDDLLSPAELCAVAPNAVIVPGACHHPGALLRAARLAG